MKISWPLAIAGNTNNSTLINNKVYNNTVYDVGRDDFMTAGMGHPNWIYVYSEGAENISMDGVYLYNNKFYNDYASPTAWGSCIIHIGFGEDAVINGTYKNIYIYNNVMYNANDTNSDGICLNMGKNVAFAGTMDNLHIYNNSFWNTPGNAASVHEAIRMIFYDDIPTVSNIYIKNNNMYMTTAGYGLISVPPKSHVTGNYEIDYNNYYIEGGVATDILFGTNAVHRGTGTDQGATYTWNTWRSVMGWDTHGWGPANDPKWVSTTPATMDLNLTSGSPTALKTGGADLGSAFGTDILGVARGAGNWSVGAYQYAPCTGDCTAPVVTITTADPSAISANSLSVAGTATDAVGVVSCKYRVGSAPDSSNGIACTGTTDWSCSTVGYASGTNGLYVGCVDAAGNWGVDSIVVNYTPPGDDEAPVIIITGDSPRNIDVDSLTVAGTATDNVGVTGCKWEIGTEPSKNEGTACTGTTAWSCATSGYVSGANTLYIECYDAEDNYSSGNFIVVYYTPPPVGGTEAHSLYIRGGKIQ